MKIPPITYKIQSPQTLQQDVMFVQRASGTYKGNTFLYNLQSEIISNQWTTVGFSTIGFRGFQMQLTDDDISYKARFGFNIELPPNLLLTSWQLAYWPSSAFDGIPDMTVEGDPPDMRTVFGKGTSIARITYDGSTVWDGVVHIIFMPIQLEIAFTPVEFEYLP